MQRYTTQLIANKMNKTRKKLFENNHLPVDLTKEIGIFSFIFIFFFFSLLYDVVFRITLTLE